MNFILRNLGWILLFLFFLFMLFIISTSQNKNPMQREASGSEMLQTGSLEDEEEDKNLDNFEKLVEKVQDEDTSKDISVDQKVDKNIDKEEDKKSIFDIFKRKDTQATSTGSKLSEDDIEDEQNSDMHKNQNEDEENTSQNDNKTIQTNFVTEEKTMNSGMNLEKNTGKSVALKKGSASGLVYRWSYNSTISQNTNISTAPGKEFQIWVHSLKLNNKNFTQKLGVLIKGDVVKQLWVENSRGCFEIEVLESQKLENLQKKGYVCKKYLAEKEEPSTVVTQIQDTQDIKIEQKNYFRAKSPTTLLNRDRAYSNNGVSVSDVLLQISPIQSDNCFLIRIIGSNIESQHGKEGYICQNQVSTYQTNQ